MIKTMKLRYRLIAVVCLIGVVLSVSPAGASESVVWEQVASSSAWSQRDSMGEMVYDGKMWLLGGYVPERVNDVWSSTDGMNWTQETESAGWSGRNLPGSVVFDDKMWILGGFSGPTATLESMNDVWSSQNGSDWTQAPDAPWSERGAMSTCVYDGRMWVMGGFDYGTSTHYADVWSSTDGTNWTQVQADAPWGERAMHGTVVFQDKMWVIGGGVYDTAYLNNEKANYNDVWSSADGINWTQVTPDAGWAARRFHSSVVYDGKLWVIAGYSGGNRNDVWYSEDGETWTQADAVPWGIRHEISCMVYDESLWMMGGYGATLNNDVWKYTAAPEPATLSLLGIGALALLRRRK